jgi:hypothetical protein
MATQQDFKNHGRVVPIYHMGVFFPLVINFLWSLYRLKDGLSGSAIVGLLVSVALILLFFSIRVQILTVQDRVIRLEMQLRLARVLPRDLQAQIPALTIKQLVALRFAGDEELPELTRDVLAGKLSTQKEIKMRVKNWQPDVQRA